MLIGVLAFWLYILLPPFFKDFHSYAETYSFSDALYDIIQKYFVSDIKYLLLWIFIFSYRTYLVEKLLFYALHKELKKSTKSFSTKYVVYEKISIHNNEIFHVRFAILQKTTEETCKNVR